MCGLSRLGGGGYPGQLPWWPLLGGYPGQLPWWPLLGGVPWSTSMMTTSGGGTLVNFHDDHFRDDHFHDDHFQRGLPCDLSHNAVHVISAPLQTPKWWVWLGAHAYIVLPQRIVGRSHGTPPPRVGQIDRQTRVNALPSPILRMRSVKILNKLYSIVALKY